MSIDPINHYSLTNPSSVYDEEALTALELAARTAGKVNEVIADNNNFKTAQEQKTAAFVQQMKNENASFVQQLNEENAAFTEQMSAKFSEMETLIMTKMAFRYVYDYTNTAGAHPKSLIPPIFDNGSTLTIAAGVYHCPTGNTIVPTEQTISHPSISSATMYYLVRAGLGSDDAFSLKLSSQIISTDVIFCGCYFHTSTNVTLHNENLFLRYDERIERRDDLNEVRKNIFYDGFVHSGAISINTVSKTISVEESLLVTVPRFSGFLTVPVYYNQIYTLPDGSIGSFMFSVPYNTNTPSNLRFGLVSAITANGYSNIYLGAFGNGKLIGGHFADTVKIKIDGVEMLAGDIKNDASFVPAAVSDLLSDIGEDVTDIVIPDSVYIADTNNETPMKYRLDNLSKKISGSRYVVDEMGEPNIFNADFVSNASIPEYNQISFIRTNSIGKQIEVKQTSWHCVPWSHEHTDSQRKIMLLGDSMIGNDHVVNAVRTMGENKSDIAGVDIIGTRGSGNFKHEGRSQWSWYNYVNSDSYAGITNPFRKNGKLDLYNYAVVNNIFSIDYVFICLGTNDVNRGTPWTSPNTLDAKIERAIANAKTFIDALFLARTGDPTQQWNGFDIKKIFIILPTCGRKDPTTPGLNPGNLHYAVQKLNERYIAEFDKEHYGSDVAVIPWNLFSTDDAFSDAVHPNQIGAERLANLIWGAINYDEANNPIYTL